MSGSGKPGSTFKVKVVTVSNGEAVIEGEAEDFAYLVTGVEYVVHFVPVGSGHTDGDDQS